MSITLRFLHRTPIHNAAFMQIRLSSSQQSPLPDDGEFRILQIRPPQKKTEKRRNMFKTEALPPRSLQMPVDQDWGSVWPGPRTFHPASVPLPVRQGRHKRENKPPPAKWANAELMKIPNFLHLTPPVVKRQCEALKRFCTPWPEGLETEEKIEQHCPLKIITSDYCLSSPSIRNPMARIVTVKLRLAHIRLDERARDKFLRLVGERYDPETDELTIVTDRCPLRKQNLDYSLYCLTAVTHESRIKEPWEDLKSVADMEKYVWEQHPSRVNTEAWLNWGRETPNAMAPRSFVASVERLMNEGESEETLDVYKAETLKMFGIAEEPQKQPQQQEK